MAEKYKFVCKRCNAETLRITVRSKKWRSIRGTAYHKCYEESLAPGWYEAVRIYFT